MNPDGQARFNNIESSSEEGGDVNSAIDLTNDSDMEEGEVPRKRIKTEVAAAPEPPVPKWSNPDPYTSLPPPESLGAPKKDIVHVIRKSKIDSAPKSDSNNAVKENADFISFSFDDGMANGEVSDDSDFVNKSKAPASAPVAPSAMTRQEKPSGKEATNGFQLGTYSTSFQPINSHAPRSAMDDTVGPPPPPPAGLIMPTDEELVTKFDAGTKGKKRKREEQAKAPGAIVQEWEANDSDPTPWYTVDHSRTANLGLR